MHDNLDNAAIAEQLEAFASLLDLSGAGHYTSRAYRRAAFTEACGCAARELRVVARMATGVLNDAEAFPGEIDSVSVGKPTLEDVFIHLTGHRFEEP